MNIIKYKSGKALIGIGVLIIAVSTLVQAGILKIGIWIPAFYISAVSCELVVFSYYLLKHRENKKLSVMMIVMIAIIITYIVFV